MIRKKGDRKCQIYSDFHNRMGEWLGQNSIEDLAASQDPSPFYEKLYVYTREVTMNLERMSTRSLVRKSNSKDPTDCAQALRAMTMIKGPEAL